MSTATEIGSNWQTVAVVGYTDSVSASGYDRRAHGGVCLLQARRDARGKVTGRRVNSNGRYQEIGNAFPMTAAQLANWQKIGG
jgi:hypothetical protein